MNMFFGLGDVDENEWISIVAKKKLTQPSRQNGLNFRLDHMFFLGKISRLNFLSQGPGWLSEKKLMALRILTSQKWLF